MKGKLFKAKANQPQDELLGFFKQKNKPWDRTKTKEYFWKSSIPEKWIDLKGEGFFQATSDLKRPKFSIDLLQNTQRYIHDIQSFNKSVSPKSSPTKFKKIPQEISLFSQNGRIKSADKQRKSASREFKKRMPHSSNPITLLIENRPSTGRCTSAGNSENCEMNDFLNRFDHKPKVQEHVPSTAGLFGWKLKRVQNSKRRRNSSFDQIIQSSPQSEQIFRSICMNRLPVN